MTCEITHEAIRYLPKAILLAALLGGTAMVGFAFPAIADSTWTGAVDDRWYDTANWDNGPPVNNINMTVNGGSHSPVVRSDSEANSVRVGWGATGVLTIGNAGGPVALLTLNAGVGDGALIIGAQAGGHGTVTVGANGAVTSLNGRLEMASGNNGSAATAILNILNGGKVNVAAVDMAWGVAAGQAATITVAGANSELNVVGGINMGRGDGNAVLNVTSGGRVTTDGDVLVAGAAVSGEAPTATLTIQSGGVVTIGALGGGVGRNLEVGGFDGAGSVSVTGANSLLTITGGAVIGGNLAGILNTGTGHMEVLNGGRVLSLDDAFIAAGGGAGSVRVVGPNSTWDIEAILYVGVGAGAAGKLDIANGGRVETIETGIGAGVPGARGVVNVTGAGSSFYTVQNLHVGVVGRGYLAISNGAFVGVGGAAHDLTIATNGSAYGYVIIGGTVDADGVISST